MKFTYITISLFSPYPIIFNHDITEYAFSISDSYGRNCAPPKFIAGALTPIPWECNLYLETGSL